MIGLFICLSCILLIVTIIMSAIVNKKINNYEVKYFLSIFAVVLSIVCGGIISIIESYNKPQAIDVYRGKTTLQITYQDNIPVDSVVIFKNNIK